MSDTLPYTDCFIEINEVPGTGPKGKVYTLSIRIPEHTRAIELMFSDLAGLGSFVEGISNAWMDFMNETEVTTVRPQCVECYGEGRRTMADVEARVPHPPHGRHDYPHESRTTRSLCTACYTTIGSSVVKRYDSLGDE